MESGTPGMKSTRDGWLNRYLHAKDHAERSSPFRAVALAQALPRSLQGTAPALAIGQLGQFGIRAGNDGDMMAAGFEAQYSKAADSAARRDRQGSVRRREDDEERESRGLHAGERRRVPARGLRRRDAADRADHQGRSRPRSRVRRDRATGTTTPTKAPRTARSRIASTSSPAASPRSRSDLGDRMADVVRRHDVGVRPHGGGERQPRHRSRPRQRDADPRRQRQGRQGLRQVAGPRARQLYQGRDLAITTDFRDVFAECVTGHLGAKDISKVFPGYAYKQKLGFIKS